MNTMAATFEIGNRKYLVAGRFEPITITVVDDDGDEYDEEDSKVVFDVIKRWSRKANDWVALRSAPRGATRSRACDALSRAHKRTMKHREDTQAGGNDGI